MGSARKLIGATNPLNAEPGTIRGDLCIQTGRNIVHGSDSPDNGERETGRTLIYGSLHQKYNGLRLHTMHFQKVMLTSHYMPHERQAPMLVLVIVGCFICRLAISV